MKTLVKITLLATGFVLVAFLDVASLGFVADANAQYGTRNRMRRRTARRTAIVVSSAESSQTKQAQQQAAASEQKAAEAQKEADAAKAEADAAKQEAADAKAAAAATPPPPPPPATGPLPVGTVVSALPADCTATTADGQEYYHCGDNFYRAAFQGSQLVYVTTAPP